MVGHQVSNTVNDLGVLIHTQYTCILPHEWGDNEHCVPITYYTEVQYTLLYPHFTVSAV